MALELPTLVQRLVLDASGFKRGAAEAQASFTATADAADDAGKRVAATASDHKKAGDAAEAAATRSQKAWKSAGTDMADVGKKMSTFITLPLVGVAAAAVKTAGEFEATLNTMAAVAGVPGPELQKLGDLAKKMGADTVFSANEAAGAMLNLSKAGISTADIMGGGVQATLALAAAGGLDLATAATVAGNAMNTFGLEGKDAGLIADALAGAANASSADVADLAMALSQGGLAAHAAGLSIQETTAVLAAFADAGLRGSDAGTSLKSFLLNLVPSSKPARAAMADLGLSFVDMNGAMLPLPQIAQRLQDATRDLSDEQKTLALQTIFGTDAYRAALVISEQGAEGLAHYTEATSKAGTAAEVADARMKGWTGTWEQFKGSMETAALSIGQVVIPAITPLVDKVKSLADGLSNMNPEGVKTIVTVGGIAAAMGPVLLIAGKFAGAMGAIAEAFGTTALAATGWGAVAIAVVAGLVLLWKNSETFRDVVTKAWGVVGGYLKGVWEGQLQPIFKDFMRVIQAIEPILKIVFGAGMIATFGVFVAGVVAGSIALKAGLEAVSLALQVMAAVFETVGRNLSPIFGRMQEAASTVWQAMQEAWDGITGATNTLWHAMQTAWDGITGAVNAAWQAVSPVWQGIQGAWDAITSAAVTLWHAVQEAWDGISSAVVTAWHVVDEIWRTIVDVVSTVLNPAFLLIQAVVEDVWEMVVATVRGAWATVGAIWDAIKWAIDNLLVPTFNLLRDGVVAVWNAIGAAISFAWESVIKPAWDAIQWVINNVLVPVFNFLREGVENVWNAIKDAISFAWNNVILPVWQAIQAFIDGPLTTAFNTGRDVFVAAWDAIGAGISAVWNNVVQPAWHAMQSFIDGPLTTAFNTFRDVASDVWNTFSGAASTAWDTVKSVIGSGLRAVGGAVNGFLRVVANIADAVGLDHIAGVLRGAADAAGGWGQGLAAGGAMGSAMAVGGGFRTDGPQAVVGEGNPMYPEFVIPTDPKHRSRATDLLLEARDTMFHASGTGRLGRRDTRAGGARSEASGILSGDLPGWLENVVDFGSDVVEGVGGALADAINWTVDQVRKLGRAGLEKAWPKLGVPDHLGGIPPAGINAVREGVLDKIWGAVPPEAAGGGGGPGVPYDGSGRIGSGWQQITGYLDSVGQPYQVTSTTGGTHTPGSLHYAGKAVDMVGDMGAIFRTLAAGNPVPGINELFYDPMGYFYDEGSRVSGAIGGHSDHVHAATFDKGGVLWPGKNVLYNATGSPEGLAPTPGLAFGGLLPGPNPWDNPHFNPGAWLARNVDEFVSGVPAPDAPTPADLSDSPAWTAPGPGTVGGGSMVIADGAFTFAPVFQGAVSPSVQAEFNAQLRAAIQQILQAIRQGVR